MACEVNAEDITARASTPGMTVWMRGSAKSPTSASVSSTSTPSGMTTASSSCSPLRIVIRVSCSAAAIVMRNADARPGRGAKAPGANRGTEPSAASAGNPVTI